MTDQRDIPEIISSLKSIKRKPPRLVPLFSWRSVLIMGLGLVLGISVALGYWLVSPFISSSATSDSQASSSGTGLLHFLGIKPTGPYESKVSVQVVNPGSDYKPLSTLQQLGEYYAAKASSLPFFEFLNQELAMQPFEHKYTIDELNKSVSTQYDYKAILPALRITVTAPTEKEATLLAGLLPQSFRSYLVSEEKIQRQKQYDSTLTEITGVKTALYDAQQNLDKIKASDVLDKNPDYISLSAKVDALQQLLKTQANQLITQDVGGADIQAEYDNTVIQIQAVAAKIAEANKTLQTFKGQSNTTIMDETPSIILDAKIKALQAELDKTMTGYTLTSGLTPVHVPGLAELIAVGDTTSTDYQSALVKVETTSRALSDAKNQLNNIRNQSTQNQTSSNPDYQVVQIKIETLNSQQTLLKNKLSKLYQQILGLEGSNNREQNQALFKNTSLALTAAKGELDALITQLGFDRLAADLDVKIAEDNVNTLNSRLSNLTTQLSSLVGDNGSSQVTDYLVAGNPSVPSPVLPERTRARNTLMIGAVFGLAIAWGLLNFRWIANQISSLGAGTPDGNNTKE